MSHATVKDAQEWLREHEEERSPARATVYSNGTDATIFYAWQPQQAPPEGWQHAGALFVVPQDHGWKAKAHATDVRWQDVMAQALPLFEAEVRKLIDQLNANGGFSLADLPELLKLGNDPERLKELDEQLKQ